MLYRFVIDANDDDMECSFNPEWSVVLMLLLVLVSMVMEMLMSTFDKYLPLQMSVLFLPLFNRSILY